MAEKDTLVFQGEVKSAEQFIKSLESYPLVFSIAEVLYSQNVTTMEKFINLRKSFCEELIEYLRVPLRQIRVSINDEMILKAAEHLGNSVYNYYYNKGIDLIESNTRDITSHISKFYISLIKVCLSQKI